MTIFELMDGRLFCMVIVPVEESPTMLDIVDRVQIIARGVIVTRPVFENDAPEAEALTGKLVAYAGLVTLTVSE
jgi:hypothetical protein